MKTSWKIVIIASAVLLAVGISLVLFIVFGQSRPQVPWADWDRALPELYRKYVQTEGHERRGSAFRDLAVSIDVHRVCSGETMSQKEVLSLLGKPDKSVIDEEGALVCIYRYRIEPESDDFYVLNVYFSEGKLKAVGFER